jgi:hypothetical protein
MSASNSAVASGWDTAPWGHLKRMRSVCLDACSNCSIMVLRHTSQWAVDSILNVSAQHSRGILWSPLQAKSLQRDQD